MPKQLVPHQFCIDFGRIVYTIIKSNIGQSVLLYLYFKLNVKLEGKNEFEIQISSRCHAQI